MAEMITLCVADDCPMKGRHAEHITDYALRAAREWFAPSRKAAERENARHHHPCNRCDGVLQSMEQNAQQLAAIIRKHATQGVEGANGIVYFPKCNHAGEHYTFCGHPDY